MYSNKKRNAKGQQMNVSYHQEQFEGGNKVIEYLGERILLDQTIETKRKRFSQYDEDAMQQKELE